MDEVVLNNYYYFPYIIHFIRPSQALAISVCKIIQVSAKDLMYNDYNVYN